MRALWVFTASLLLAASLCLADPVFAQEAKRMAILDFRNLAELPQRDVDYMTEVVRTEIRKVLPREQYLLMTKENIKELLPPDKKDLTDCEGECEIETGRMLGAQYLVTGEIVRFVDEFRITIRLYDVENGNLLDSQKVKGGTALKLESELESLSQYLCRMLPGARKVTNPKTAVKEEQAQQLMAQGQKERTAGIVLFSVFNILGAVFVAAADSEYDQAFHINARHPEDYDSEGAPHAAAGNGYAYGGALPSFLIAETAGIALWAVGQQKINKGKAVTEELSWIDRHDVQIAVGVEPESRHTTIGFGFRW